MNADLSAISASPDSPIREIIARMNRNSLGIVLVTDAEGRLAGTVSDGDIRRAVLADFDLAAPASSLLKVKAGTTYAEPITAPAHADRGTLIRLFRKHRVRHLPLVDNDRRVVDLATMGEFMPEPERLNQAVIMAGGAGTRLHPLTEDVPKPMLPIRGRPLMEIMIDQLRSAGIRRVSITTHHKTEQITEHFGDGRDFGVELGYVTEDRALGTAGALRLMEPFDETLLVINGDILTEVDFQAMLTYHREHDADLTVAVHKYQVQVPYGVVETEGPRVRQLTEKPVMDFFINAGIYMLEPAVQDFVPAGKRSDMTDLIGRLLDAQLTVVSFPIHEFWMDIGHHDDYQRAQRDAPSLVAAPKARGSSPGPQAAGKDA